VIRLALNASSLLVPHTGIGAYTRNLASALRASGEVDPLFFYGLGWSNEIRQAALPGVASLRATILKWIPRPYWLKRLGIQQRSFNQGARAHRFDVYHEPGFLPFRFDGPTVITIHDLSPLRYPETHPPDRVRNIKEYLPKAVEQAARIIVDSAFVKREVIDLLAVDPNRIHPILLGASAEFKPRGAEDTAASLHKYGLQHGGYMLAVGTLEPRKNLLQGIDAHAALPAEVRRRLPFVVAGAKGWLTEELDKRISAAEARGEVRWLGYVPAEDLPLLYAGARLLVYPSIYEGFGLPVLEAMASAVPVVTSNRASLPEVAGDAAIMVDPNDRDALRDAIARLAQDDAYARERAALGIAQARRFSWEKCAQETIAVYREVLRRA
jgi:glycosyltransferase involved in cell wall biosynthesis